MKVTGLRSPWLALLVLAVLTVAASVVSIVTAPVSTGSPRSRTEPAHPGYAALPSVALPAADQFNQIALSGGELILSGDSASRAGAVNPSCVSALVDAGTLVVGRATAVDCNDPTVDGSTVAAVNRYIPDSNNATISIAYRDPRTGRTSIGPVVMTYGSYSDTRPVTASGGGWFWIYDNSTTEGAEILQVSMSSGRLVRTVTMPTLYRPLLAADDDGLWIGNSIEGGTCSGCAAPSALYFVAPGSAKVAVVVSDSASLVCWLVASADHVWAGMGRQYTGCTKETIRRFDGSDARAVFEVPDRGYDPDTVIGDASDGLWTMLWDWPPAAPPSTSPRPQDIVQINPDTGAERVVATLPPLAMPVGEGSDGLLPGQAVIFEGSLYLLEPPFRADGYLGYSTLVKVRLP